mmetsp:Transcript_18862/g.48203  ORF Transcript_18862/g.48203 Transcript_18862/m.48203 type:complete len:101 (+) Transcript_18862:248-550(+)|eukprot:CAMPEP_0115849468 /NCGR_PEP_ID=MMETSP0287-20121206/11466_1 /TAXON_ID=412157 /ORGANISM="Chrysochromulina rotalis, Strain UIO044" /LENGTH=100 /DNA_ID=CAMNT_0003303439 /DNA_START=248 /DNA_END=550 /DNA_ORIENTATION=+
MRAARTQVRRAARKGTSIVASKERRESATSGTTGESAVTDVRCMALRHASRESRVKSLRVVDPRPPLVIHARRRLDRELRREFEAQRQVHWPIRTGSGAT